MPSLDLQTLVLNSFSDLFGLPVIGEVTQQIWNALELTPLAETVIAMLIEKAEITSQDGQLHSFMFIAPGPGEFTTVLTALTWPHSLSKAHEEATQQFFKAVAQFQGRTDLAGVVQFDLFLGDTEKAELRLAWLPYPGASKRLPEALRNTLLPWGPGPSVDQAEPSPPGGSDIVALAQAARELSVAMEQRLRLWPAEDRPASPEIGAVFERFAALVPNFNAAVKRVGLGHTMPISRFDGTWLPHNLENALRFGSLAASLKADLLRVWGLDAQQRFAGAWKLFETAFPGHPPEEALASLSGPPLKREPINTPPPSRQTIDVFISYAWSDKTRGARDIYEMMVGSDLSAWLDEEERPQDSRLDDEITAVLLRSNRIVICLSAEMLTRGGYALHEVLLAVSRRPSRCLIARLDRMPLPAILAGIRAIAWFEKNGPRELLAMLKQPLPPEASICTATGMFSSQEPFINQLIAPLQHSGSLRRHLDVAGRQEQLAFRARLYSTVLRAMNSYNEENMASVLGAVDGASDLLGQTALSGEAITRDPTIFGAALRLRSGLFRAHIQIGAHDDWEFHNRAAYEMLDEILSIDPTLFRPASELGWLTEDCRLAVQDCLDVFDFAIEWFRGWPPDLLVEMCAVSAESAATVEDRTQSRMALLGERMMALRAWEDCQPSSEPVPSWAKVWSSLLPELKRKFQSGAHPATRAYFEELNRWIDQPIIDQLSTAMADGVIESQLRENYREQLIYDLPNFRLRCVIRCYKAVGNKRQSFASVRGTVLSDLTGEPEQSADLNILCSLFTQPLNGQAEWKYGLYLNCLPSELEKDRQRLPVILRNPFLMGEMLTKEERHHILGDDSVGIYEEV